MLQKKERKSFLMKKKAGNQKRESGERREKKLSTGLNIITNTKIVLGK